MAYRLRLLLDFVAVDRCRMELEEGRKKVNFAPQKKLLSARDYRMHTIRQKIYTYF